MDRILGLQNAESMRRTILLQEQIFKHQVRELHRIYNLQKELMDELEKGLIQSKDPQPGVEKSHFPAYITRDNKEPSSSCSGEISRVPITFDLENRSESAPSRDLKGIDEETDVEVELTLSIGHCPRKQISKQCISGTRLHDSDQVGESSSSSLGTRKREECGDPGSNISSSSGYRDNNRPHWLLQDLSLNRT